MNKPSFEVMNNIDLFTFVLSFLRKKAKKSCKICGKVCVWDKKVNDYIDVNYYPSEQKENIYCYQCYQGFNGPGCKVS